VPGERPVSARPMASRGFYVDLCGDVPAGSRRPLAVFALAPCRNQRLGRRRRSSPLRLFTGLTAPFWLLTITGLWTRRS